MSFKVATIVGTRPEIIRLSRIIAKLNEVTDHTLIHTGQNFSKSLNHIFFKDLNIPEPNYKLDCAGENSVHTIANVLKKTYDILSKIRPNAVLVLGDTNSALSALSAKRLKIPVFHFEAGNRSFDDRVPEEINRRIVDHIADINLTYSQISREYLIREGIMPDKIIKIGSPMNEVISFYQDKINNSKILDDLSINNQNFIVLSCHREENIEPEKKFQKFVTLLNKLSLHFKCPIVVTAHPRTKNRIIESQCSIDTNVILHEPFSFTDYCKLQKNASIVISDSGTIAEESSILEFNAINIRDSHERPEAIEESPNILSSMDYEDVIYKTKILIDSNHRDRSLVNKIKDYENTNISEKILRIILGYTSFVERETWKKY
jgi:UDP-N-acetylglucosamine 2-epimerase